MSINMIQPTGPHIEGVIRFASEGHGDTLRQLDHFEVLSRVHDTPKEGALPKLMEHPISQCLLPEAPDGEEARRIRVIPIRLIADSPERSLRARYEAYDAEVGRLLCVGNGERGERADLSRGTSSGCECPGPDACSYANTQGVECSLHVRLRVQIEGQEDPFSVFELQSGGINSYRTLAAKLEMMHKAFGSKLRGLPLQLVIYAKSSVASSYQAFYVADLRLRSNMTPADAMKQMSASREAEASAGLDFAAMEEALAEMDACSSLSLNAADSVIVTFTPVQVDRSKLRRDAGVATKDSPASGPCDISQLVSKALQFGGGPVPAGRQHLQDQMSVDVDGHQDDARPAEKPARAEVASRVPTGQEMPALEI